MQKIELRDLNDKSICVEIVDDENDANFITHSGTFHADEVMATVFLINKYGNLKLYRTSNVKNDNAFAYDVGFGLFDHHQSTFDRKRENDIKYASCGLVWDAFSYDIAEKLKIEDKESFKEWIDKNLVMDIDRDDNGQALGYNNVIKQQTLPNLIALFNPNWDDNKNENECFLKALSFANSIFNNMVISYISKENARKIVEKKIEESSGSILFLDNYMPWKDIVLMSKNPKAKNILYAIFPSKRGGYNIVATPKECGSFDVKKPFPSTWAGLEKEELRKISGIKTINFCHKNLFICSCDDYDDAIKIAKISIEYELSNK